MDKIDPNAPAFPVTNHPEVNAQDFPGLSIRAEFAKAAMSGLLANSLGLEKWGIEPAEVSKEAVRQADALIAELNREPGEK